MPAEEEEDEQPMWQSVALFCCKGIIEGIIVVLFLWLLVQVLFTKELEVHLQVLLGAGLAVFCLSLLLGCFLCLWQMRSLPAENKESPALFADCSTTPSADATSSSHSPPMRVLNEEPEEEEEEEAGLDYPSAFGSSTPSDDDFYMLPLATRSRPDAPKSYFPLRRLSSPTLSAPLYRPMDRPRSSLPCLPHLPRLSFLSRTRRALERRCTVAADAYSYTEHSRLTGPAPSTAPYLPGSAPTLSHFQTQSSLPNYGTASSAAPAHRPASSISSTHNVYRSTSSIDPAPRPSGDGGLMGGARGGASGAVCSPAHSTGPSSAPCSPSLQFSLCFSAARRTVTLTLLGLSGAACRLGTVTVLARLPPARPLPAEVTARHRSLSPELHGPDLELAVSSLEELRTSVLTLDVFSQDLPGHTHTQTHTLAPLGQLELACSELAWEPEMALTYTRQLRPLRGNTQRWFSHDAVGGGQTLPQLFILMQYQSLPQRLKVMVLKAENLSTGTGTQAPGTPDHHVVVNLRHAGVVVSSQATQGAAGQTTVWNSTFLFDLPPGDVTQLPLVLEFILIKGCLYSTSNIVGRIVIGQEAEEAGQAHWRDMCNMSQVEVARWHVIE
ncbi:uncharacterized protein LOC143138394 [Alosa pseudoharengus]|uniref:uncharacterized protein LOC143138394 n=1 Tax=Alosa pseudoharengus TaxID=34774 RepID=UPI003F89D0ED